MCEGALGAPKAAQYRRSHVTASSFLPEVQERRALGACTRQPVTLKTSFSLSGCSAPLCIMESWLHQMSEVPSHSESLIQEQQHEMNAGNKVLLLHVSLEERWRRA